MKRILIAMVIVTTMLTVASCGSGETAESTNSDTTVVVTDTTSFDTTSVAP